MKKPSTHFVKPTLVAEIKFFEWTEDKQLRQPIFKGSHKDKKAQQIKLESSLSKSKISMNKNLITWEK